MKKEMTKPQASWSGKAQGYGSKFPRPFHSMHGQPHHVDIQF